MVGEFKLFNDFVYSVFLHSGHKEDSALGPSAGQGVIVTAADEHDNGLGGKIQKPRYPSLVISYLCNAYESRHVVIVIRQHMLHSPLPWPGQRTPGE